MTPELKGLARNAEQLVGENEKLSKTNNDLLDRIAILESALRSEKSLSAAMARQHEADLSLIKQKDEELKALLTANAYLQIKADSLSEVTSTYQALQAQDWSDQHRPDYGSLDDFTIEVLKEENIREYGKTANIGMKVPVYLQVLIDKIEAICLQK